MEYHTKLRILLSTLISIFIVMLIIVIGTGNINVGSESMFNFSSVGNFIILLAEILMGVVLFGILNSGVYLLLNSVGYLKDGNN